MGAVNCHGGFRTLESDETSQTKQVSSANETNETQGFNTWSRHDPKRIQIRAKQKRNRTPMDQYFVCVARTTVKLAEFWIHARYKRKTNAMQIKTSQQIKSTWWTIWNCSFWSLFPFNLKNWKLGWESSRVREIKRRLGRSSEISIINKRNQTLYLILWIIFYINNQLPKSRLIDSKTIGYFKTKISKLDSGQEKKLVNWKFRVGWFD